MTSLRGTILAENGDPINDLEGITLMGSFIEKNGRVGTEGLIQKQIVTKVSPNHTCVAPGTIGSKVDLKPRTCDLESQLNREEEAIVTVKAGMSEEIQRLKFILHTKGILLEAKEQPVRRSNRRRKLRVYFP